MCQTVFTVDGYDSLMLSERNKHVEVNRTCLLESFMPNTTGMTSPALQSAHRKKLSTTRKEKKNATCSEDSLIV